jgi:hypothetical protein
MEDNTSKKYIEVNVVEKYKGKNYKEAYPYRSTVTTV